MTAVSAATELFDCRDAFAQALHDVASRDDRVVAVVNDSVGSSKLGRLRNEFPDSIL